MKNSQVTSKNMAMEAGMPCQRKLVIYRLLRCGKSCRLRWINYLRPDIKRGKFNLQEEQTIFQLHALLGNRWSVIVSHLPKRTDNEIKNYWNTHLKRRLIKISLDPMTHKARTNHTLGSPGKNTASLSHMAQWESVRLLKPGVVAGMFTFASQDLRSLTSTPNFSDGTPREIELHPQDSVEIQLKKWGLIMHGLMKASFANTMWGLAGALLGNFGVLNSSMTLDKTSESCSGNTAENRNCWDSILNLVNSPPLGSPVF
ncbi:hypothetical protein QUC31_013566 [Theobroma cacao]